MAATALILSNSPVSVMTVFAENQADVDIQSVIQKAATIDQSIYGDLLKDKMNPQAWNYLVFPWQQQEDVLKNLPQLAKVNWVPYSPNSSLLVANSGYAGSTFTSAFISKVMNPNSLFFEKRAVVANNSHSIAARYQDIRVIPGRTYTMSQNTSFTLRGNNAVGQSVQNYVVVNNNTRIEYSNVLNNNVISARLEQDFKSNSENVRVGLFIGNNSSDGNTLISTETDNSMNVSMKYAAQWKQVDDLFGNQQHTILASGVNGTTIQAAIQMAQNLPASNEDKQAILAEANKAWNLYQIKNTVLY